MKLRRMVEDKKCCGMRYYRLRCFFSSDRVESATHRHYWKMQDRASHNATRRRCRTAPLENFPFRLNYRLDEWGEKEGGEKKEEQGKTERKRERERKKESSVHTYIEYVYVAWSRKWQMRTGRGDYDLETVSRALRSPERLPFESRLD